MTYRLNAADTPAPACLGHTGWHRSQLPTDLGVCINDRYHLEEGLALAYAHYHPQQDLIETSNIEREERCLTITVALEGASSTLGIDGQRFEFVAGHSTLAAFASVRGQRRFPAHRTVRQLRLIVQEAMLHRYRLEHLLEGVRSDHSARHIGFAPHAGATANLAQSLISLRDRDAGPLDMQIAALSLLAEQTRCYQPLPPRLHRLRGVDQDGAVRVCASSPPRLTQRRHIAPPSHSLTAASRDTRRPSAFRRTFHAAHSIGCTRPGWRTVSANGG